MRSLRFWFFQCRINNKRWGLTTIRKKSVKAIISKCKTDRKEWTIFAKYYKEEFFQYYYESYLNEMNSNPVQLLFPSKFRDKINNIKNIDNKTSNTLKATQARWKNYAKSDYKYNPHNIRKPKLPLQHNLRCGKHQLTPWDGFCVVDFKYIDKFYDIS